MSDRRQTCGRLINDQTDVCIDVWGSGACLEVAVTTKCRSGREACNALMTASFPTPLGPLMTTFTGSSDGICFAATV